MIRKLQWKFVTIIMSIVTITFCVILGLVYHFTKMNLEAKSINMMQNIAVHPFRLSDPNVLEEEIRLPYFVLQIDENGEIVTTGGGYYDLSDEEFLRKLTKIVFDSERELGMIEEYHLRYYHARTPRNDRLVFADVSNELAALNGLMKICCLIGGASLLAFLWISILLARWTVKPIDVAWKQQRQFVADASHELKTPLTVIMTNAELMQNGEYEERSKDRFLEGILIMSRQMKGLIEQMLELARADYIQTDTVFHSADLSKLISDAVLPFEPVFFEKGFLLTVQIDENIWIQGIETQLRQLLEIFLDNAGKYSRNGGMIWVTLKRQKRMRCILTVANEGDDIEPEDLKQIFKRFYRADKTRNAQGSFGLGLSIAENIVKRHKGKIWAESKDGINYFYVKFKESVSHS